MKGAPAIPDGPTRPAGAVVDLAAKQAAWQQVAAQRETPAVAPSVQQVPFPPGLLGLALPSTRRGQKLQFSFDEDEVTLAWQALRQAALAPGTKVAADAAIPLWLLAGFGLVPDPASSLGVGVVATTAGPCVAVHEGAAPDVEPWARAAWSAAPLRNEAEWQRHRVARDAPDTENDYPLGAYVVAPRHEEITRERMHWPNAQVVSWTLIGSGAAPTEFIRLQDAVGAYHVVLVEAQGKRTVGIWCGHLAPEVGAPCEPVLRRLYRTQGAWRHGIKFQAAPGKAAP